MKIKDLGERHAKDFPILEEDAALGYELAGVIGDTFIDWNLIPPAAQWTGIVEILRVHGLKIVEAGDGPQA